MTRLSVLVILIPMISTRWKKKITIAIIIGSFLWSFSYAQESSPCFTCSSMAPELQAYISFANQIIDIIGSENQTLARWASYNVFWPWQWGNYNGILADKNPSGLVQGIVLWTLKNIDKRQSQLRATTEVLSIYTMDIILDGWLWFLVAAQPWPIMRDFQYLLDIDTLISDKIYDLWAQGAQGKKLTPQERTAILQIMKSNTGQGKLLDSSNLDPAVSSTEILRIVLRINTRNKKALTLSTTSKDNTITAGKSTIELSKTNFENLVNNYKCARIGAKDNSCWSSFNSFKESIKNITQSFIESGPKQSQEKIVTAYKRLITRGKIIVGADKLNDNNLKEYLVREHELITSRGDGSTLVKRSGRGILTGALSSNIPRQVGSARKALLSEGEKANEIRKDAKEILKPDIIPTNNFTNKQEKILEYPLSTPQTVLSDQLLKVVTAHHNSKEQQLNVNTQDSQEALQKISYRLRIINDLLATNIKSDLTRTCNLQCSNLWWICW